MTDKGGRPMTLIDKAEAALAVANVQFGYYDDASGDWRPLSGPAIISAACKAIHALPARGVGVRPLVWEGDEEKRHDLIARPDPFHTYTVRPLGDARFDVVLNHELGSLWFRQRKGEIWPDYASAKAAAQADYDARISAALAPTDAAHVNETPKSEHDGADVLTAAQARETHLREAAAAVRARYMGDNNREDQEVLRCEAAIMALIGDRP